MLIKLNLQRKLHFKNNVMYKAKRFFPAIFIIWLVAGICNVYSSDNHQSGVRKDVKSEQPVLNMYTWVGYLDPEIVSDFEKEFQVKVQVDFYEDEEEMFSAIQSNPGQYDIVFPTDYMVDLMTKTNLLLKLDMEQIPNMRNIESRFKTLINKKWKGYFVTLDWGGVGIAYNTKYVKEPVDSWRIFWDTRYRGRMALVNNYNEVMSIGQKLLGFPLNPTDPKVMDKALELLEEIKPLLQGEGFLPYNEIRKRLISEELWIAQCYNADTAIAHEENNAVKFVLPKEGTGYWVEGMAVPIGANNKPLAESFINFMLRPEVSARHTNYSHYANCNNKSWIFVDKNILRNPYIYMKVSKFEVFEVCNPDVQQKFNECWSKLISDQVIAK